MKPTKSVILVAAAWMAACGGGGGGGGGSERIVFEVPPRPTTSIDGSGDNLRPPREVLEPWFSRRTTIEPEPLDRAAEIALEEEALVLARNYLASNGFSRSDDVRVRLLLQDEYGGAHVKLEQTHEGVPVIGAGIVCHLHPDAPDGVTDALVKDLDVDTTPTVSESEAEGTALGRYPGGSSVPTIARTRLAVLPLHRLERVRAGHVEENTEDFDRVLEGARLVWEVVVEPEPVDVPALAAARLSSTPPNTDPDDSLLELLRLEHVTRAGNDRSPPMKESFSTALMAPGVRTRIDAHGGD